MERQLASHRPYGDIRLASWVYLKGDSHLGGDCHLRSVAVDSSDKLLIRADVYEGRLSPEGYPTLAKDFFDE